MRRTSIRNLGRDLKEDVVVDVPRRGLGHCVCVLEEKWLRVEEAQWQRVGFCLGKELSRDWGSFGRATAGCRTSRQGVQCPGVDSGCVLRCQLIERRAIELVGTDSV
jgi:hypothetical protein